MTQIQEIKELVGQAAEQIIANELKLKKTGKKYHCPNIYEHTNGDKDPSMSWDNKLLRFYCFRCGHKIDIYNLYRDHLNYTHEQVLAEFKGESDPTATSMHKERQVLRQQVNGVTALTDKCKEYLLVRGISEKTMAKYKLRSYNGMIAFPYIKYNIAVGMKLRQPVKNPPKPKYSSMKGSKPWLFGAQLVDPKNPELIICEGEIDSMCLTEAGISNSVSIGAGANSVQSLIEQAKDFLSQFETIIVISDNDDAGSDMDKLFTDLLGDKIKLPDKRMFKGKDINEHMLKGGKLAVKQLVDSARVKVEGRRDLDLDPYKGLDFSNGRFIPTGIPSIDNVTNDLMPGLVTVVTGRTNGGKSTLVRQIIANAIQHRAKCYLVNGEEHPEMIISKIYQCVIGDDDQLYNYKKINKINHKEPKPEVLAKLQRWHKGKLTIFNKGESNLKTLDELMDMLTYEIKFKRHDLVVLDNMMSLLSASATEKNEKQGEFVQRCCDIAKVYQCHIIIVTHPNKTYSQGTDMSMEHVSGNSDIYNKCDNFLAVVRYYDEDKINSKRNGKIQLLKNRIYGTLETVEVNFDYESQLLLELRQGMRMYYKFTL